MVGHSGKIKAEAGQRQVEDLCQSTARELARHKHVAQNRDSLAGKHSFYGMKLLAEAQRGYATRGRALAVPSTSCVEPSLPSRWGRLPWLPMQMNECVRHEIGCGANRRRPYQIGAAHRPERVSEELIRYKPPPADSVGTGLRYRPRL